MGRQKATVRGLGQLILVFVMILAVIADPSRTSAAEPEIVNFIHPTWTLNLPAKTCPWSEFDTNCHYGSPTLADVSGDGLPDVVVVTRNGHVLAVTNSGELLWDTDVAPYFGMASGTQEIGSTPAVADLDNDGHLEIVVGVGTIDREVCTQGGVMVLDHLGRPKRGWPQLGEDWAIPPVGCADTFFSSPSLGDLDADGDLEIVAGGFDMRIYAWHHDGTLMAGFPPSSALYEAFPWDVFRGRLADTVWSSPALADLDKDGYPEIIIGTDEGNQGNGWTCPYALPVGWRPGYCGGSLYVMDHTGNLLPGFPRYIHEAITSSPAIVDLDEDGWLDIVVGTGRFYYSFSPDRPQAGFRVYAWDRLGRDVPGWAGGKPVGGAVPASPAVGDLDGDGSPEVVAITFGPDKRLYAWHRRWFGRGWVSDAAQGSARPDAGELSACRRASSWPTSTATTTWRSSSTRHGS